VRAAAPLARLTMGDAAPSSSPPSAAAAAAGATETAGEASLRIVCTPEEERIFATLLAAVRHFGVWRPVVWAVRTGVVVAPRAARVLTPVCAGAHALRCAQSFR
jgi:hypothetical protein